MSTMRRLVPLILIFTTFAGCGGTKNTEDKKVTLVFAAASLAPTLDSIAAHFERTYNLPVSIGYGASGMLAQQIRAGAGADLYLSADTAWIERLQAGDSSAIDHWWPLLTNHLLVAALSQNAISLSSLRGLADSSIKHIVLADPQAAPAGRYAKASLENTGLWDIVAPKIVYAENVTAAVQVIRTGVADVGFAYTTDITAYPDLEVAYNVPDSLHPPIVYGLAVLQPAVKDRNATAFAEFIRSNPMLELFRQAGFIPIPDDITRRN